MHHRNPQRPRCKIPLVLCGSKMKFVENYKYLGCWVNEFGKDDKTVQALTATVGRSFGRIVDIFRKIGDMGHKSFLTLFDAYILPIANYAAAVWGFRDHTAPRVLQNRIHRFYLGVHHFASVAATGIEMDQPLIRSVRWLEMLHYHDRILKLPADRWPRVIYEYDILQRKHTWVSVVDHICRVLHLPRPKDRIEYDLDVVYQAICRYSREVRWNEASKKPKLRCFIEFKDRADPTCLIRNNLPRHQRSLLAKLSCGILPLEIETGRYSGVPPDKRYCRVCNLNVVEDEYHFLYSCPLLQTERSKFYLDHITDFQGFILLPDAAKTKFLLGDDMIKLMGEWIEIMYKKRRSIVYKVT